MEITSVKFRKNNAVYILKTAGITAPAGAKVIAETEHGVDIGTVLRTVTKDAIEEKEVKGKLLRTATEEDIAKAAELDEIEKKAFAACREKHKEKKLEMKLVNVKSLFDRSKIIFYFVAENRIDFRELVRDLAAVFRTRIEMRQIGVRDEARMLGGFGSCGRHLCCGHMSGEFAPVSIKMAKEQNLNLNSLKISGICGRLLCCLSYECETYAELNVGLPEPGADITISGKSFHVQAVDTLRQSIRLNHMGHIIEVKKEDLICENNRYSISQEVIERILHQDDHEHDHDEDQGF